MEDQITSGQLRVYSRFSLITIHSCRIHAKYGEHTKAEVSGTVKGSEAYAALTGAADEKVEITRRNERGLEEVLFSGVLEGAELKEEDGQAWLSIRAVSDTWKMDVERKSRSFQDITMSYKNVAENIISTYDAEMTWDIPDKALEYPLIQYEETDYCFLRRILSHLGRDITVTDSKTGIHFCAGISRGSNLGSVDLSQHEHALVLFHNRTKARQTVRQKQMGYKISGMDYARVGDVLSIQGRSHYVMEVSAELRQQILFCTCSVFPIQCFETERIHADTLRGMVLTGRVLGAKQETLRLCLDIDKKQEMEKGQSVEKAYDFPWRPITGNLLYCMPERGSRVALYFGGEEENQASVIYVIRENGERCREFADCRDRYFSTEHNKRMYLKPSEIGLSNQPDENAEISLQDESILQMKTTNRVSLMAQGQVELRGKNVVVTALQEATLVRKDILSPTVVNLCNAFDSIGNTGGFAAVPQQKKKKRKQPVSYQKVEEYPIYGAAETILSNIPADMCGDPVLNQIAGGLPVIGGIDSTKQ